MQFKTFKSVANENFRGIFSLKQIQWIGHKKTEPPILSSEVVCPDCGALGSSGAVILREPPKPEYMWFCLSTCCLKKIEKPAQVIKQTPLKDSQLC